MPELACPVSAAPAEEPARQSAAAEGAPRYPLRVLTLNVHKGREAWNRRYMLAELRNAVRATGADLVFLQEVIGERHHTSGDAPGGPDYEFLADSLWPEFAYGRNAVTTGGHHGNALLSRHRIRAWHNHDASVRGRRVEPRGLLHCVIALDNGTVLHAVCVHLGLRESHRRQQLGRLCALVTDEVPADAALVVAGDFNDWRERADAALDQGCGLKSAFAQRGGSCPRTFPARWPLLRLDRIYVRGVEVQSACALSSRPWPHLSDHLPLLAEVLA